MTIFKILYWIGTLIEIVIRAPYQKNSKAAKTKQLVSRFEQAVPGLLAVGMLIFPLIYSVTTWLDFANYSLPAWLGWLGVPLLICALLIFARAHTDLKSNWSPTLEIFKNHTLVTNGIYGYIRHPMYASQWLWVIAQILLLQNWLAGPIDLILFLPLYILRVKAEEKMMLETYGEQYREYAQKTGAVIPKF
jgi:protein-S-isoprenylcysteine O-methyltransferase Ste14